MGLRPLAWATLAAEAAREFGAVKIVAESNRGGEMTRDPVVGGRAVPGAAGARNAPDAGPGRCLFSMRGG